MNDLHELRGSVSLSYLICMSYLFKHMFRYENNWNKRMLTLIKIVRLMCILYTVCESLNDPPRGSMMFIRLTVDGSNHWTYDTGQRNCPSNSRAVNHPFQQSLESYLRWLVYGSWSVGYVITASLSIILLIERSISHKILEYMCDDTCTHAPYSLSWLYGFYSPFIANLVP